MEKLTTKQWVWIGIGTASLLTVIRFRKNIIGLFSGSETIPESKFEELKSTSTTEPKTEIKVGDKLYPLSEPVNIRTEPKVDNGGMDFIDNLIYEKYDGLIGVVLGITKGEEDGLTWYKVRLAKPKKSLIPFKSDYTEGYVRIDAVKKG